jgi:hypothetical protein
MNGTDAGYGAAPQIPPAGVDDALQYTPLSSVVPFSPGRPVMFIQQVPLLKVPRYHMLADLVIPSDFHLPDRGRSSNLEAAPQLLEPEGRKKFGFWNGASILRQHNNTVGLCRRDTVVSFLMIRLPMQNLLGRGN